MSEVLTIRISTKAKTDIENLQKATGRSKSYLASKAVEEYLAKNSWQIKELSLAENEIKEGKFIESKTVEEYLSSWGKEEID